MVAVLVSPLQRAHQMRQMIDDSDELLNPTDLFNVIFK